MARRGRATRGTDKEHGVLVAPMVAGESKRLTPTTVRSKDGAQGACVGHRLADNE